MNISLGRLIVLVKDYDEAFAFYNRAFGCEKLFDMTTEAGQRFLHIRFPSETAGIWFLQAQSEEQLQRVGKQTGQEPMMVLYTDDLEKVYAHLQKEEVKILEAPQGTADAKFLHCADLYGNHLVVVELVGRGG